MNHSTLADAKRVAGNLEKIPVHELFDYLEAEACGYEFIVDGHDLSYVGSLVTFAVALNDTVVADTRTSTITSTDASGNVGVVTYDCEAFNEMLEGIYEIQLEDYVCQSSQSTT